jgi:hypothetical protein
MSDDRIGTNDAIEDAAELAAWERDIHDARVELAHLLACIRTLDPDRDAQALRAAEAALLAIVRELNDYVAMVSDELALRRHPH